MCVAKGVLTLCRVNIHNGYMSGGASYVLSRQALRIMGRDGLPQNGGICKYVRYS